MRIVADEHIPFLRGVLEPFAELIYLPGQRITSEDVRDADALLVRTRTRCSGSLLDGSRVRFIGSATIGTDHIDVGYCAERSIQWVNAPGCNASSVTQYVGSALACIAKKQGLRMSSLTMGIIGAGNVGSRVERLAKALGMRVLVNDPPRARQEGAEGFVPLDTILRESDVVTIHVPLHRQGSDRTYHLGDSDFFDRLLRRPFLINTSRGEVVDTAALKQALLQRKVTGAVIDVWENEPEIDRGLLAAADIATPHIAGYSVDGKANGTTVIVRAVSRHFGLGLDAWQPQDLPSPAPISDRLPSGASTEEVLLSCIELTYNVADDSRRLKESPGDFERQRENYPVRRDFPFHRIRSPEALEKAGKELKDLGFGVGSCETQSRKEG